MSEDITLTLDGEDVTARPGESLWALAKRHGAEIPHLCHSAEPGYRADGNCRACMVEIEGERTLAASCIRAAAPGMKVVTQSERAVKARAMVMELLLADQPPREKAHDAAAPFWSWADAQKVTRSRFPSKWRGGGDASAADMAAAADARRPPADAPDLSHAAMAVNLDACINCGLCVRACREVQVNDVIGMAYRGHDAKIVFDFDDPMGASTCVACGECVQACPTGALTPKSIIDLATQTGARVADRKVESVCPYCGVGCQVTYHIRGDRIAWVDGRDGPANEQRLCVKGRFGWDYIQHPNRLTKPLIRRDGAPKGLNVDPANPLTHFREASWEEALDVAAAGLARLRDQHGGKAVAGFGSAKGSNEEAYLVQKLIRAGFGHNTVDHCTRLCHASSVAALMENVGSGAVTASFNEIEHADVAIAIGCNPIENHPVAATYFKQFVQRGGALIVMDPRGHALKRYATHMLQFKPGGDVSLLNAIMHVIVAEGMVDRQYVAAMTENFDALKAHLERFSPEAMAPLCGIEADAIREVARVFGRAKAAMIFWGMGVSQHVHGTDNSRCLISLALMTGQVGRPGTGLHPLRGQNNVQGASDAGLIPMVLPDYRPVGDAEARAKFEAAWGVKIDPEPGLTVVEIMDAVHAGAIRGVYVMGENPAMSDPDLNHARAALAKLEHLVVQDIFLTETAMFADVVLPATAWPEKDGTVTNTNRQVQMGRAAVKPPGEARPDLWIIVELAKRLGLDWDYQGPAEVFAEMAGLMPSLDNITWARLEREDAVTYPSLSPEDPGQAVVFGDKFPRAGGRAKFTPASVTPPAELPDADYPFVLTTGRVLEHWHTGSMTRRAGVLDAIQPVATVSLHPSDIRRLGLRRGDQAAVETRRGRIELAVKEDRGVSPGMAFIPFAFVEAAANVLTNPQLDPYGKIPEFKFCAARVIPAASAAASDAATAAE